MLRRLFIPLFLIMFVLFLTSCELGSDDIVPNSPFTIDRFFQDGMVLPQNQKIEIKGKSEKGVTITGTLYDEKGNRVKRISSITDEQDEFILSFDAPKASNVFYKFVITDSINQKTLDDLLFGYYFLYLGENLPKIASKSQFKEDENIFCLQLIDEAFEWAHYSDVEISDELKTLFKEINAKTNYPIALIDASVDGAYLDNYLSLETINNYTNIYKYLKLSNRIDEDEEYAAGVASINDAIFEQMKGLKIDAIVCYHGHQELVNLDSSIKSINSLYINTLNHLYLELANKFNAPCFTIQSGFEDVDKIAEIRVIEAMPSYNMKNVTLIPTYDCYSEEGIIENKYFTRIASMISTNLFSKHKEYALSLSDIIHNDNEITLSFFGSGSLVSVNEIYGLVVEINGLEFDDFTFHFDDEEIVIVLDLADYLDPIDDINISYGFNDDIYNCNLLSTIGLPVVPFNINLDL